MSGGTDAAARMGARAAETYRLTGSAGGPIPFDTSPDAPDRVKALVTAYCVAYVAALPKPVKPTT
jgi:hypothetical protein